jgi:hypothetical protein
VTDERVPARCKHGDSLSLGPLFCFVSFSFLLCGIHLHIFFSLLADRETELYGIVRMS